MRTRQMIKGAAVAAALAATGLLLSLSAHAADLTGAGATFPFPIYSKWAEAYKATSGIGLNYQSIGSGGGIRQIKAKTVDFGASDMPLKADELEKEGLTQFPAIIGGVVPVFNLDSVAPGELKLTGEIIAAIHLGKITKWNDKAITSLNPSAKLPDLEITVVHRADGSGTTFLWTDYLSKVSPEFKEAVGSGTAVKWPTGVGGKGNEGVAANIQRVKGSFGYVEYAYAKKNKIDYAALKNRDGAFVQPDDETFKAAADKADWAGTPGMAVILTNQAGKNSWPATGASYIIMHKAQANADVGRNVLKFFEWAFKSGGQMATELDYVPLPASTVKLVHDSWKTNLKDTAGKAIYP